MLLIHNTNVRSQDYGNIQDKVSFDWNEDGTNRRYLKKHHCFNVPE